jgi:hypothetical protein
MHSFLTGFQLYHESYLTFKTGNPLYANLILVMYLSRFLGYTSDVFSTILPLTSQKATIIINFFFLYSLNLPLFFSIILNIWCGQNKPEATRRPDNFPFCTRVLILLLLSLLFAAMLLVDVVGHCVFGCSNQSPRMTTPCWITHTVNFCNDAIRNTTSYSFCVLKYYGDDN